MDMREWAIELIEGVTGTLGSMANWEDMHIARLYYALSGNNPNMCHTPLAITLNPTHPVYLWAQRLVERK